MFLHVLEKQQIRRCSNRTTAEAGFEIGLRFAAFSSLKRDDVWTEACQNAVDREPNVFVF